MKDYKKEKGCLELKEKTERAHKEYNKLNMSLKHMLKKD